ncbi:integrase catalytic domain-containing protein [Trichonephila clavipes]|nr:integrase catalytic domain-containing protein [Trichonephila clavipes]
MQAGDRSLWSLQHVFGHQSTARRTWTHRYPVLSFAALESPSCSMLNCEGKSNLANDDEIEGYILEKQELLDTWEEMLILLERRVSHLNKTNKSTEVIHTRNSDSTEIKLPTLSLPTFSGVIDEWLTFSDLFQAAVTNNQNLTGAQKLQYLKGVLKGDAQKIVQSLPITDGNFQIAWDLLKERYFHKREILSSLMKKLMNISPITCESHAQILKLVDSTKECVRLLETLDLKVEGTADIILMFIIQFKLDSTTRGWWERSLDNEKFLRSASFYNFFRIMLDHL